MGVDGSKVNSLPDSFVDGHEAPTKRMASAEGIVRLLMFDSVKFPQEMKSITLSLFVWKAHLLGG
jgi:hypothetical protein